MCNGHVMSLSFASTAFRLGAIDYENDVSGVAVRMRANRAYRVAADKAIEVVVGECCTRTPVVRPRAVLFPHGSLHTIIEKRFWLPIGELHCTEVAQMLNESGASGCEDGEWSGAKDVTRGGGAVEQQALEPCGNAVEKAIASAADLETGNGVAWAVFFSQEMLQRTGHRVTSRNG